MGLPNNACLLALLFFLSCFCSVFGTAIDTITSSKFIKDSESIISSGSLFKLGFFSPGNSSNRYLGIWYYKDTNMSTVIWVANRNKPLKDSSGVLTISEDGNLVVLNRQREILWSSNVSTFVTNSSAQLQDSGNLVLQESATGKIIWESFEHPSNSFLPKMKLGEKIQLTSWKSDSDPSMGSYSAGLAHLNVPELFIWKDSLPYWRSGPWNGQTFIGVTNMRSVYLDGISPVDNKDGTEYVTYAFANQSLPSFVLNPEGKIVQKRWVDAEADWSVVSFAPEAACDIYGRCGEFGSCHSQSSPICTCLRGFEPKNIEGWKLGNWTGGCGRRKRLQCDRTRSGGEEGKEDGFLELKKIKVPDFAEWSPAPEEECEKQCLKKCSCIAYAYGGPDVGCMFWSGKLIDIQNFSSGGVNLYIRVANSELDKKIHLSKIIRITVIVGMIIIFICSFLLWKWITKNGAARKNESKEILLSNGGKAYLKFSAKNTLVDNLNQVELQELPLYDFEKLAIATNNFHIANKLGQGGFGPVYRGKLQDGQEIAVKRLSRASQQGLEEFINEVVVISKLQHRNLVRLLGCCIEGVEKMLIYEYMPNKSLDIFIFDPLQQELLDWRKRFNIIKGIARGLLYLHRDSRLRIIHRDLKASNILLDEHLNPKISDFGLARIFGGNEDEANTRRVVGTYGYMSPEYAMEGLFSEKSDVFSFGVLLLEIVSGRKNTCFYHNDQSLRLIGFAWKMWKDDEIIALVDPAISDPCFQVEILRCIHVGLLCVQESAKDRPTVSTVISMLDSERTDLPTPNKPAFTESERQMSFFTESFQEIQSASSINNVTTTIIHAR